MAAANGRARVPPLATSAAHAAAPPQLVAATYANDSRRKASTVDPRSPPRPPVGPVLRQLQQLAS